MIASSLLPFVFGFWFLVFVMGWDGTQVVEIGGAFTLANYADGYEMWLNVKPKE